MVDVAAIRQRFSAVAPFLNERGRRVVAAAEASAAGYGGIAAVSAATGLAASTIGRGLRELSAPEELGRIRRPGGGRKTAVAQDATLLSDLGALVEPTSRGDPQSPLRWTCKSVRRLAEELQAQGHRVGRTLVSTLLDNMGFRNGPFGVKPPSDDLATVIVLPFVVDAGRHIMPSDRSQ